MEGTRERARSRDLRALLATWNGASSVLSEAMGLLQELLGSEKAVAYTFATERGVPRISEVFEHGAPGVRSLAEDSRSFSEGWAAYDPTRPMRVQRNRVMSTDDLRLVTGRVGSLQGTALWRGYGLHDTDQLRVLLCDGPVTVAWVGGFQPEPFRPSQRQTLQRVVPALRRRLVLESRLRGPELSRAALAMVLEHVGGAGFIVSARGQIAYANEAGRALLQRDRRDVHARLVTGVARGEDGFQKLTMNGAPSMYIAILPLFPEARRALAGSPLPSWELTGRQQEVLRLVLDGHPNKVIAAHLDVSVRTVEVHVSAILERVGVESRSELLARALRELR